MNWESAVKHLRTLPESAQLIKDAYLDENNINAAERFEASLEFKEVMSIIRKFVLKHPPWNILDIGAGSGIATYAFAKSGNNVFAVEPNPSYDVGANAIRKIQKHYFKNIQVLESPAEKIPLSDEIADIVYIRQALHHADDLKKLLFEAFRILKSGGLLLATREHVVSNNKQLKLFLDSHPLHKLCQGEFAYPAKTYINNIKSAGFSVKKIWVLMRRQ